MLQVTQAQPPRYGFAVLAVLVTLLLKLLLSSLMALENSFFLLCVAVAASACYGGMRAGLFATALAALVSEFFFISPEHFVLDQTLGQNLSLGMFLLEGGLLSWLITALYSARQRSEVCQLTLKRSEEQLRQIAENVNQVIWMTNPDMSQMLYVNHKYEQMWGRATESLYQQPTSFLEGIHPEDRDRILASIEKQNHGQYDEQYRIVRPDGSVRWVRSRVFPIQDEVGQVYRLTTVVEDITQEKRVEAELRKSEAKLRRIVDSNIIGIFFGDISGNVTGANDAFLQIIGYTRQDLQAGEILWNQITPPDYINRSQQAVEELKERGVCVPFEKEFVRKDGSRVFVMLAAALFEGSNEEGVCYVLDISDRKRAEQERDRLLAREQEARRQAEAASRTKDEFLAIVSHELRSPLTAILGWSKLMRSRQLDAATTSRALDTIERNAQAQSQLIEDLLDISRIIRGTVRLYTRPLNLVEVIEVALDTMQPTAVAKTIQLESRLDPNVGLVCADPTRLQQIVWNLLSNAVKFTPKGGRVEVRLAQVGIHAQIQVSDTGKGISPDFLPHIFERFRQADSTTTKVYGGLGLGLAIVRNLVELHGGTIQAESLGEGQGTIFTLALPLISDRSRTSDLKPLIDYKAVALDNSLSLKGIQVLLVDDEIDTREFIVTLFQLYGVPVTAVASAAEALQHLQHSKPDVLLSDIGLPVEDGYTLIRKIRALPPEQGGQIPAVALSAFARQQDRIKALSVGFQMHVVKPIEPLQLLKVVANLARKV